MWLKLTKHNYKPEFATHLVNMNNIVKIETFDGISTLYSVEGQISSVKESLAEIELMLMGSKPNVPDPRERNVIGGTITGREIE